MPRIPIIIGPTAAGKTALAVEVALECDRRGLGTGEIISADAFQVYRGMDIGTGKATEAERRGVVHHLIDLIEPDTPEPFTARRWLTMCEQTIEQIRTRGHVPIVVGGTHLYIKALVDGMFIGPGADEELRRNLEAMDPSTRREELERIDPASASRIHPNDTRRTVRALEVHRLTGVPISEHQSQWDHQPREDCVVIGLQWDAEAINGRINRRVREMVDRGLVQEVRRLSPRLGPQARQALGYKQILEHLEGTGTLEQAIERTKIATRRYAKNQRTWLRRLRAGAPWLTVCPGLSNPQESAQHVVNTCLARQDQASEPPGEE